MITILRELHGKLGIKDRGKLSMIVPGIIKIILKAYNLGLFRKILFWFIRQVTTFDMSLCDSLSAFDVSFRPTLLSIGTIEPHKASLLAQEY